jgi:hypothetical protein
MKLKLLRQICIPFIRINNNEIRYHHTFANERERVIVIMKHAKPKTLKTNQHSTPSAEVDAVSGEIMLCVKQ